MNDLGRAEEAEAECRKAIDLWPDLIAAHNNLGYVLLGQARFDDAVAEYRKALALRPNYANAQSGLGSVAQARGRFDEAEAAFRRAVAIQPDYSHAYNNLGVILAARDRLEEAEAEYRKALVLKPNYVAVRRNLVNNLVLQGRFGDALDAARKWRQEAPPGEASERDAARQAADCERLIKRDGQLAQALKDGAPHASAPERLEYARVCGWKKLYGAAARFYADAFKADPKLAENLFAADRYAAARAAALAAGGKGKDADQAAEAGRVRWRNQAREWLGADLALWTNRQQGGDARTQALVERTMRVWQIVPDLADVRGSESLAKLPAVEQDSWREL